MRADSIAAVPIRPYLVYLSQIVGKELRGEDERNVECRSIVDVRSGVPLRSLVSWDPPPTRPSFHAAPRDTEKRGYKILKSTRIGINLARRKRLES